MIHASVAWRKPENIAGREFRHRSFRAAGPPKRPSYLGLVTPEIEGKSEEEREEVCEEVCENELARLDAMCEQESEIEREERISAFWESFEPAPRPVSNKRRQAVDHSGERESLDSAFNTRSLRVGAPLLGKYLHLALGFEGTLREFLEKRVDDLLRQDDRRWDGGALRRQVASGHLTMKQLRDREATALSAEVSVFLRAPGASWLKDPTISGLYVRRAFARRGELFFTLDARNRRLVGIYRPSDFNRAKSHRGARRKAFIRLSVLRRNGKRSFH